MLLISKADRVLASHRHGEVYRARDNRLGRDVAVKVLPGSLADNAQARERFEREARAVSKLNHPHICTLFDVGDKGITHFLVTEYLGGETLAQRIERGALPLDLALKYAEQTADALWKAHRAGVVHRDLKPSNVFLTKQGLKLPATSTRSRTYFVEPAHHSAEPVIFALN